MVHQWALKGARPAPQLAPGVAAALPLLTAVQVGVGVRLITCWAMGKTLSNP